MSEMKHGHDTNALIEAYDEGDEFERAVLEVAIGPAIDAVYAARDGGFHMHEAGAAAAVAVLRAVRTEAPVRINGRCPMGCGETLAVAGGGHIVCMALQCPDPAMLDKVISHEAMDRHIVILDDEGFSVQHPLSERLTDMTECDVHQAMHEQDGAPASPGRYYIEVTRRQADATSESFRSGAGRFTLNLKPVERGEGEPSEIVVDEVKETE